MYTLDQSYVKDLANKQFAVGDILDGKNPARIELNCTASTQGILQGNFGNKNTYSIGGSSDDFYLFTEIDKVFEGLKGVEGWQYNDIVKAKFGRPATVYFKLKLDKEGRNFTFNNNIGLVDTLSPCFHYITRGCRFKVFATVHAYFDPVKKTYGLYLAIDEIEFNQEDIDEVKKYYE